MNKISLIVFTCLLTVCLTGAQAASFHGGGGGSPPGLSGKGGGEFPRGLEKNEKTPAGWSHGEKTGWHHHHHHHHYHVLY